MIKGPIHICAVDLIDENDEVIGSIILNEAIFVPEVEYVHGIRLGVDTQQVQPAKKRKSFFGKGSP